MQNRSISLLQKRLNRRRLLRATVAGSATLAVGCGAQRASKPAAPAGSANSAPGTPQPGGTFASWLVTGNLPSLDPQQTPSAWTMDSAGAVMSRILRFQTSPDPQTGQDRNV